MGYHRMWGQEALRLLARIEAILLDPVYFSKAMAALIATCEPTSTRPAAFWRSSTRVGHPPSSPIQPRVLGSGT